MIFIFPTYFISSCIAYYFSIMVFVSLPACLNHKLGLSSLGFYNKAISILSSDSLQRYDGQYWLTAIYLIHFRVTAPALSMFFSIHCFFSSLRFNMLFLINTGLLFDAQYRDTNF